MKQEEQITELYDPAEIRVYLGAEATLPANPLDQKAGGPGGINEKKPMIRLELRDKDNCCVVHLSPEHFGFLESRVKAVRRLLDALSSDAAPIPPAAVADGSKGA